MQSCCIGATGSLLLLTLLFLPGGAVAQQAFGELKLLKGKAVVLRGRLEIHVVDRIDLKDGDRVKTAAASRAHIRLFGQLREAEAIVTQSTTFSVNTLKPRRRKSPFHLLFGAIRSRVASRFRNLAFVRTATAAAGIKGTDFIVYVVRKKATEFIGVEGLIEAASLSRPEFSIRIGKRQWGEIVEGEKPKPPVRVPDDTWEAALREFAFPQ
jgi:hypothetical protein